MPWYRVGSVAITAGQNTVTGTGTNFSTNARVGDAFQGPDGRWYEVTNIASGTVLSILPAYQGATVSAGAYGLAPMQGYVKESADRLRQLVDQFGATLALFGGATTAPVLRQNIGAAERGANSDITSVTGLTTALSVAQGGTGGKTQVDARAGLGLGAAAVAAIVGPVSMSGGAPNGAIIERGSNANGEYTKYADGTLICSAIITATAVVIDFAHFGGYRSGQTTWVFPASFVSTPSVIPVAQVNQSSGAASGNNGTTQAGLFFLSNTAQTAATRIVNVVAIGRWF
ncbi:phage tail protein [Pseudomonas sp. BT-42-2]|uniref:phage tail protein n=1 Tax=Pseudomonas sp. BT-42-2 TaxID=2986927 RepID=UPI0021F79221|nr:phage tail protein [Pseudomonas sp. BT-42-2]MCV9917821.1 phage tail protein [Pseudomonas sp. BT-42-2]